MKQLLPNLSVTKKGILLVAIPLIFEIGFVLALSQILSSSLQEFDRLEHAKQGLVYIHKWMNKVTRALIRLIDPSVPPSEHLKEIQELEGPLRRKVNGDSALVQYPEFSELKDESQATIEKMLTIFSSIERALQTESHLPLEKSGQIDTAGALMALVDTVRTNDHIVQLESRIRTIEPEEMASLRLHIIFALGAGVLLNCLPTLLLARLFASDFSNRISKIGANAQLLASGKPLLPPQEGSDEIAKLDRTLHQSFERLEQSWRREKAMTDGAADIICALDARLRFLSVGAACQKLWLMSAEELLGVSLPSLVSSTTVEATKATFSAVAADNVGRKVENEIRCPDGTFKHFEWDVAWLEKDQSYSCVAHDVTELRAIERMKQQFLSMVSHDLRAPLTSIGFGLAALLTGKRGSLTASAVTNVQAAQAAMEGLTNLVNELLEVEKLQSGKLVLNTDCVGINEILVSVRDAHIDDANAACVTISGPRGDAAVMADERRITLAASKLLSHAIKRSPAKSMVDISIESNGKHARVCITDSGPAMAMAQRATLFESMGQSEGASGSSGFGFYLVKVIIEMHGGTVGVDTGSAGNTFWFTLPEVED